MGEPEGHCPSKQSFPLSHDRFAGEGEEFYGCLLKTLSINPYSRACSGVR